MALSAAYQVNPRIVVPGGAVVKDNTYRGVGSVAFESGNICRVNTGGTISQAVEGATTVGDFTGMFLSTGYQTTGPTTSQIVSILEFTGLTQFHVQLYAASAGDAEPQDVTVGLGYRIKLGTSYDSRNRHNLDVANADGSLLVVAKPSDSLWFESDYAADTDYGIVQCRVIQSVLDGRAAA